ncbi:E3 ubiquitin-protein ligase NEURL3 isoform X2 [Alligator sinensis]|uniref:E3 ubiquitin-protein ligase NEURL3 isoform X2 n=1 Tax=Alligator sinensis TaxID=38654 RepID=A0A3Q0FJQ5_ALLSI|nr:E3 ubiquitin-protein ligase NEURL3 isoform X2 [Alligator sinensis]
MWKFQPPWRGLSLTGEAVAEYWKSPVCSPGGITACVLEEGAKAHAHTGAAIRSNRAHVGPAQHRCQLCSSPGVEKVKTAVMGSCKSSLNGLDKLREASQPLCFHPTTKGFQIQLDAAHRTASRADTFCDGIVFSNRPVQLGEKVVLRVLRTQPRWDGGLRVGFTSLDPSQMIPKHLPRFACPSLVLQGRTWASLLPNACEEQGTIVRFWLDHRGRVFFGINNEHHRLLLKGVPVQGPLWAVIDVYGQTKAVQLLDQYGDLQELPPELPCSFFLDGECQEPTLGLFTALVKGEACYRSCVRPHSGTGRVVSPEMAARTLTQFWVLGRVSTWPTLADAFQPRKLSSLGGGGMLHGGLLAHTGLQSSDAQTHFHLCPVWLASALSDKRTCVGKAEGRVGGMCSMGRLGGCSMHSWTL